ncbi:MAG: beta-galactosidase GalA [Pirellulales bacterium]
MKQLVRGQAAAWILVGLLGIQGALAQSAIEEPRATPATASQSRERLSLDRGWLFHLGDIPFPELKGQTASYENAKAGRAWGAAAPDADDSEWRTLDLPHDWAIEGTVDRDANLSQGYRRRGVGWYRRHFRLPSTDQGRHLELRFDGVATHATVWVNGILAHRNWCGYTSFAIDITPFARFGDDLNTVAVRVDADPMEGWWYEGAGIYRHTWLVKRAPVHLATDGVYANPVRNADDSWTIPYEATVESSAANPADVEVEAVLVDPAGKEIVRQTATATVDPLAESVVKMALPVVSPQLWSVDEPTLYELRTTVWQDGHEIDQVATRCGFRTIRFDADQGFFLNDQPLKLKGVCNHQDHAGVGVAVPDSLWEFRLRRLKEMGANAYRCSHHPPAAEFLDECDRLGMLVMDENRNFNTTPETMRLLEWLVRRDRNHPSVILWSVFNEEPMQGTWQGYEMVRRMAHTVKQLDTTRPVTAAQSNSMLSRFNASQAADVAGFNYQHGEYDAYHAANPSKPVVSSEDTSAVMTRGEYATDRKRAVLASYDTEFQPWGTTHRNAWKQIAKRPFVAGGFVWTGFDYHGEPQPLEWPATASSFGCLDLCGFPKAGYYLRQAMWIDDRPIVQILPHWNWTGRDNEPIKVMVLTNGDSAELSLNGKSLGEKSVDPYEMVSWNVPYEPGNLVAVVKRNGEVVGQSSVETTGDAVSLRLVPDRSRIVGDGCDALPITVEAVDAEGRVVPTAQHPVQFTFEGPAAIIGVGNGDPNCHEPEQGDSRSLFNGYAQVILQSRAGDNGPIKLRATSPGLAAGEVEIDVTPAAERPAVPVVKPTFLLTHWNMSKLTERPPSPEWRASSAGDLAGTSIRPGRLQQFDAGRFALYRTRFEPVSAVRKAGGQLVFAELVGKAEVWIDGKLAGQKSSPQGNEFAVELPPGDGARAVQVLVEASPGTRAGLGGAVRVESR